MPDEPLNILYVHRTQGGAVEGVHIRGIVNSFRQMGHCVRIVSVPGVDIEDDKHQSYDNVNNNSSFWTKISRYCPQFLFEFMEIMYNLVLYRNLNKQLQGKKIDFIYERYALNTFASTLFGKRNRIPVLLEINDATGIKRARQHKVESLARYIEKWVFKNSTSLITISSEFKRILVEKGNPERKVFFIPNAIDNKFDPDLINDDLLHEMKLEDKIIIGFVGSFLKWHGLDLVINIAPDIVKKIPQVRFLFIGDGPEYLNFKKSIERNELTEYFILTGRITASNIPKFLNLMDIGLIPDSNEYGSPVKLFEYMSMKVVPVAPDLPPVLDIIENERTGLIFKRRNETELKELLLQLCLDELSLKEIGNNAREKVLKDHLWINNAQRIIEIYRAELFSL